MEPPLNIMLVDDNDDFLEVLSMDVEDLGFRVVTAPGVDEALAMLKSEDVDIIVSDLHMDGKSGMDFIFELRELNDMRPFIFLTGAATKSVAVEALRRGAFDLLEKPIEPKELARVLHSAGKLVHQIDEETAGNHQAPDEDSQRLLNLRTTAKAFDALARESGDSAPPEETPDLSPADFVIATPSKPSAADGSGTPSSSGSSGKATDLDCAQVKNEINKTLIQNLRAIKMLEKQSFAKTSLSFLFRSFNLIRESAESIDDEVLAGASEIACNCFSYFRVNPGFVRSDHIELFREYNSYLVALNLRGAAALKDFATTIHSVTELERQISDSAA